jgi:hypothetical protein
LINRRHFFPKQSAAQTSEVEATKNPPGSRNDFLTRPMPGAANIEGNRSTAKEFFADLPNQGNANARMKESISFSARLAWEKGYVIRNFTYRSRVRNIISSDCSLTFDPPRNRSANVNLARLPFGCRFEGLSGGVIGYFYQRPSPATSPFGNFIGRGPPRIASSSSPVSRQLNAIISSFIRYSSLCYCADSCTCQCLGIGAFSCCQRYCSLLPCR